MCFFTQGGQNKPAGIYVHLSTHISPQKQCNEFHLNLVLGHYIKIDQTNIILVHICSAYPSFYMKMHSGFNSLLLNSFPFMDLEHDVKCISYKGL